MSKEKKTPRLFDHFDGNFDYVLQIYLRIKIPQQVPYREKRPVVEEVP